MSAHRSASECRLRVIASTERGRVMECTGHPGFILEFGPLVIRLRESEFQGIGEMIDEIAVTGGSGGCAGCSNAECRGGNFAIEISKPGIMVEFKQPEVAPLHELFVEARLSMMLRHNRVERPA